MINRSHVLRLCVAIVLTYLLSDPVAAQFRDASEELGFSGGGKASFADYNNDGFVDLHAGQLFKNEGGKKFVLQEEVGSPGGEVVWGDYDNDGHIDMFQFTGGGSLHRNKGDGTFEQIEFPTLPTVNSRGAVWLDVNNDSLLDLYVGGYEIWQQKVHPDVIYLNQGDNKFVEHWKTPDDQCYSARGVCAADFNEDGFVDVFVSNYRLQPNHLWVNDRKGKFNNVAEKFGAAGNAGPVIPYTGGIQYAISGHTIGSCFADMDNDGLIDIFVGNFSHPRPNQDHPQFLKNKGADGEFMFEDRSDGSGLAWQESFASPTFGDFDNDGDLDLYFTTVYGVGSGGIKNFPVLYTNDSAWKYSNVTEAQGLGGLGATYQAAWADIDNDGDLDLCSAGKMFVNDSENGNWIKLQLIGDGKAVNKSAVGAIAKISLGDKVMTRHVETGMGEGNQNEMTLHFGLGDHAEAVSVELLWPGGSKQTVEGLALKTLHKLEFGQ